MIRDRATLKSRIEGVSVANNHLTVYPTAVLLDARHVEQFVPQDQLVTPAKAFAVVGVSGSIPTTPLALAPLAPGWEMVHALSWNATISYNSNGRNDSVSFGGLSDVWSPIQIDFQGNVQGGTIALSVNAAVVNSVTGQQDTIPWSGVSSIIGLNPIPHDIVRAQLGNITLQVIAYKETLPGQRFQQFKPDGSPCFGLPNGFGIMQLDPPSDPRQIWNWQLNVIEGKARFQTAQTVAANYAARMRAAHPNLRALSGDESYCMAATYYNGGGANGFHYVPNSNGDDWIRNPNPTGNPNFAQALNYGDSALNLLTSVENGSLPNDW